MAFRLIASATLLTVLTLASSCAFSADDPPDLDIARAKFDKAVADASSENLVPILPPGSKTLGFTQREPGVYGLTLRDFEQRSGMLFADEVAYICVARQRSAVIDSCENPGRSGEVQERGDAFVYVGWQGTDPELEIDVGSDPSSLQSAFDAGWEAWLSP